MCLASTVQYRAYGTLSVLHYNVLYMYRLCESDVHKTKHAVSSHIWPWGM